MKTVKVNIGDIKQLIRDVAEIKQYLFSEDNTDEGELTKWARKELAEARKIPDSELISSEEVKELIVEK